MADDLSGYVDGAPAQFAPNQLRGELAEVEQAVRYWWAAGLMAGRRVLDVGCGVGSGSAVLIEGGAREVVGVDVGAAVVEAARATERPGLRFERCDIAELPYPDAGFDAVVCFEVTERGDLDAVFPELARVLAPGGLLATSLPDHSSNRHLTPEEFETVLRRTWPHVRLLRQRNWIGSALIDDSQRSSRSGEPLEQIRVRDLADQEQEFEPGAVALVSASDLPEPAGPVATVTGILGLRSWLEERDEQQRALDEQRLQIQELAAMQGERGELRARLIEAEAHGARGRQLEAELEEARWQRDDLQRQLETSTRILHDVMGSPSWRLTKPLRTIKHGLRSRLD